ncbi:DUF485 domain-containing protein [Luminiphilus syltensis]|uniref:DUF485 domain-containing protein n=1 Tax=Luminiphilus syltensis TaxID=1341119 RepID=UPI0003003C5C|nr:DUF485 domain-containing protein [Luminiphilus syltensis]
MIEDPRLVQVQRKTRLRLLFSGVTLLFYFSFSLNWMNLGSFLREPIGDSVINGSIVMFVLLILGFIAAEMIFMLISRREKY